MKNFASEEIRLTGVEIQGLDDVTAEIVPLEEGRRYQIKLTLSPEMDKGDFKGTLNIKTDSEKVPMLQVPVRGTAV